MLGISRSALLYRMEKYGIKNILNLLEFDMRWIFQKVLL